MNDGKSGEKKQKVMENSRKGGIAPCFTLIWIL